MAACKISHLSAVCGRKFDRCLYRYVEAERLITPWLVSQRQYSILYLIVAKIDKSGQIYDAEQAIHGTGVDNPLVVVQEMARGSN